MKINVKKLTAAREAKGWTKTDLARESGVSRRAIVSIEHGQRDPILGNVMLLCTALGIRVSDLAAT